MALDPDQWQRDYEAKIAQARHDSERLRAELDGVRVTEHSKDGQISVTVNAGGNLVDLRLGDALRGRAGSAVAQEILRAVAAAQSRIADEVERAAAPLLGDGEAMRFVLDKVRSAHPAPQPEYIRGGEHEKASGVLTSREWPTPSSAGSRPAGRRGPKRSRTDDDDEDFGGTSILR